MLDLIINSIKGLRAVRSLGEIRKNILNLPAFQKKVVVFLLNAIPFLVLWVILFLVACEEFSSWKMVRASLISLFFTIVIYIITSFVIRMIAVIGHRAIEAGESLAKSATSVAGKAKETVHMAGERANKMKVEMQENVKILGKAAEEGFKQASESKTVKEITARASDVLKNGINEVKKESGVAKEWLEANKPKIKDSINKGVSKAGEAIKVGAEQAKKAASNLISNIKKQDDKKGNKNELPSVNVENEAPR